MSHLIHSCIIKNNFVLKLTIVMQLLYLKEIQSPALPGLFVF